MRTDTNIAQVQLTWSTVLGTKNWTLKNKTASKPFPSRSLLCSTCEGFRSQGVLGRMLAHTGKIVLKSNADFWPILVVSQAFESLPQQHHWTPMAGSRNWNYSTNCSFLRLPLCVRIGCLACMLPSLVVVTVFDTPDSLSGIRPLISVTRRSPAQPIPYRRKRLGENLAWHPAPHSEGVGGMGGSP